MIAAPAILLLMMIVVAVLGVRRWSEPIGKVMAIGGVVGFFVLLGLAVALLDSHWF